MPIWNNLHWRIWFSILLDLGWPQNRPFGFKTPSTGIVCKCHQCFSSVGAGDGSFVYTHTLKNIICSSGKGSCSFRSPPGFLVDDHQNPIRFKKIISACKCIADIKPTKFTVRTKGSSFDRNLISFFTFMFE